MNIKYTLVLLIAATFPLLTFAQKQNHMPMEPGKCYSKCLIKEELQPTKHMHTITTDSLVEYKTTSGCNNPVPKNWTEWREVICEKDITPDFLNQLLSRLIELDYNKYLDQLDGKRIYVLKRNLVDYQKDNKLPVGQFDLETLNHLGIN